jgi:hypothetical protein
VTDVLYVLETRRNLISVLALKDKGYVVFFYNRQLFMHLEGSSHDITINIGVREGRVYRLKGKLIGGSKGILDHGLISVTEDEEQEAPKGE